MLSVGKKRTRRSAQDSDEDPFVVAKSPAHKKRKTPKAKRSKSSSKVSSKKTDVSDRWVYNRTKLTPSFAYFSLALLVGALMSVYFIESEF